MWALRIANTLCEVNTALSENKIVEYEVYPGTRLDPILANYQNIIDKAVVSVNKIIQDNDPR